MPIRQILLCTCIAVFNLTPNPAAATSVVTRTVKPALPAGHVLRKLLFDADEAALLT